MGGISNNNAQQPPIVPPGISSDYLIEPTYVRALDWGLYCIQDRLTFGQVGILSGSDIGLSEKVYGSFDLNGSRQVISVERKPEAISQYFAEMVGGDVCIFDLPNSFLICVLEGDITLSSAAKETMRQCFGCAEMDQAKWAEIIANLRSDIQIRLRTKYIGSRANS